MLRRLLRWLRRTFWEIPQVWCQCGHLQCMHTSGRGSCYDYQPENLELGKYCRCQKFIPRRDDDGGSGKHGIDKPKAPDLLELEKMFNAQ
jgi:hypothetical protein